MKRISVFPKKTEYDFFWGGERIGRSKPMEIKYCEGNLYEYSEICKM